MRWTWWWWWGWWLGAWWLFMRMNVQWVGTLPSVTSPSQHHWAPQRAVTALPGSVPQTRQWPKTEAALLKPKARQMSASWKEPVLSVPYRCACWPLIDWQATLLEKKIQTNILMVQRGLLRLLVNKSSCPRNKSTILPLVAQPRSTDLKILQFYLHIKAARYRISQ